MGFMLTLLIIVLLICMLVWYGHKRNDVLECRIAASNTIVTFIVGCIVIPVIFAFVHGVSYNNYLDMVQRGAVIEQEAATVATYSQYGTTPFLLDKAMTASESLTDLKYNSYQGELARMVLSLRNQIQGYNRVLIGKRTMKSNWYWNVVIYLPAEGREILNMGDIVDELIETKAEEPTTTEPEADKDPEAKPTVKKEGGV